MELELKTTFDRKSRILHDEPDINIPHGNPNGSSKKENTAVFKYIKNHVRNMFHIPMAALIKGAATLNEEFFTEVIPIAWELLLETDQVNWSDENAFS